MRRCTPETDAAEFPAGRANREVLVVQSDVARRLERERYPSEILVDRITKLEQQRDAAIEALDQLLNTAAVITPHDASYKDTFVDLQVCAPAYEAAYDILKKHNK